VPLLWLELNVAALPFGDDMQPPWQVLQEVHQVLPSLKSWSKRDFTDKFASKYIYVPHSKSGVVPRSSLLTVRDNIFLLN
jgi:hypothetical protein